MANMKRDISVCVFVMYSYPFPAKLTAFHNATATWASVSTFILASNRLLLLANQFFHDYLDCHDLITAWILSK